MARTPHVIGAIVADPKTASTPALESALGYIDTIPPADFEIVQEEYLRRTDPDYSTPQY